MSFSRRLLHVALLPLVVVAGCGDDDAGSSSGVLPDAGPRVDADSGPVADAGPDAATPWEASVNIPGLTGPVTAAYDTNGFLHVNGKTDNDAFATVGYFHAANRFFFMDFLRNAVRGTLGAKITTASLIKQDVSARTFFADPKTGDPLPDVIYASLDDTNKAVLQAYASGVNAWLSDLRANRNDASLSEEYSFFGKTITDWLPSDSVAILLYFLSDLSNGAQQEIVLGQLAKKLPTLDPTLAGTLGQLFLDFTSTYDIDALDAANGPVAKGAKAVTGAKAAKFAKAAPGKPKHGDVTKALAMAADTVKRLPGASMHRDPGDTGSNNWVINGAHTSSGRPIVANDPHLQILNPSLWFPVEVDGRTGGTGTYHAAGGSFPGLPTVQTGHNENIAWGVTVAYWDLADAYIETVTEAPGANAATPGKVSFNGQSVALVAKDVTFMQLGKPVVQTLRWVPHHGPVVGSSDDGSLVTIRWRGHDGTTDMTAFLGLGRANNLAEAKTALANVTSANQNFVIADKNGDIGYYPFSKVPSRPWASATPSATTASPFFPLDGRGAFEWGAPVATADMPQTTNPTGGFVATANGDINGAFRQNAPLDPKWTKGSQGQALPIQTWAHAEGTREQRIVESIRASGTANSLATSTALQGDTKSLPAVTIAPVLLTAAAATAEGGFDSANASTAAALAALKAWSDAGQFTCPSGIDGLDPAGTKTASADVAREAVGCAVFHVALYALFDGAFGDELATAGLESATSYTNMEVKVLVKALAKPTDAATQKYWVDSRVKDHTTTMNEILQRAITRAGSVLSTAYGATADDWRWGRFHVGSQASLISEPLLGFNGNPYPLPGGLFTVNVANPGAVTFSPAPLTTQFRASSGPSLRTQIEVGADRPRMKFVYPGGADGHRTGRFYNNLLPQYLANTPVDFPFGADLTNPAIAIKVGPPTTP